MVDISDINGDELFKQMVKTRKFLEIGKEITEIPSGFVKQVCSALHYYWDKQEFVSTALINLSLLLDNGTDEVRRSLMDSKIIFCAVVTVCIQMEYHTLDDHKTLQSVLLIISAVTDRDQGFDHGTIEMILMLVPHLCGHIKMKGSSEELFWILRQLLLTMHIDYDNSSAEMVHAWLSEYGVSSFIFGFIEKFSSVISDLIFMKAIDIAYFMRKEVTLRELTSTVPNLLRYLNSEGVSEHPLKELEKSNYATTNKIAKILEFIIENITVDGAKYFLVKFDFFKQMINALVYNDKQGQKTEEIILILHKYIALLVSLVMDESRPMEDLKPACINNMLKYVCSRVKLFISLPPCNLKMNAAFLFYHCGWSLHMYFNYSLHDDSTLLYMIKALTVIFHKDQTAQFYLQNSSLTLSFIYMEETFIVHFVKLVDDIAYQATKSSETGGRLRLKLETIIRCDLLNVVTHFILQPKNSNRLIIEAVSRLLLLLFNSVEDIFFSPRWENVRVIMMTCYGSLHNMRTRTGKIYTTMILFMWRLLNMKKSEAMVSSLFQLEINLRQCTNISQRDEVLERFFPEIPTLLASSKMTVDKKCSDKFLGFVVEDLRAMLRDKSIINHGFCNYSDLEFRWVTFVMLNVARDVKDPSLLKNLVYCALDFVADQNNSQCTKDVDEFIILLYMNR